MTWLISAIKRFAIWAALLFGGLLALVLFVAWITPAWDAMNRRLVEEERAKQQAKREEWEQGWQKWWDEHQTVDNGGKQPSNKGQEKEPPPGWKDGFSAGYLTGFASASGGALKPSSSDIDALARGQATKSNVLESQREAWKMGFSAGWGFGWSKGK
jgi:hypothetical protein